LRTSVSLVARFGVPKHSGSLIFRDALSVGIHRAETKLSVNVSLLGRLGQQAKCRFEVTALVSRLGIRAIRLTGS
jgi:hypothetical protein